MMAFGAARGISTPLLVLNFSMYMVTGAIAGWALNKNIDASAGAGGYVGRCCNSDSVHFEAFFTWLVICSAHSESYFGNVLGHVQGMRRHSTSCRWCSLLQW